MAEHYGGYSTWRVDVTGEIAPSNLVDGKEILDNVSARFGCRSYEIDPKYQRPTLAGRPFFTGILP